MVGPGAVAMAGPRVDSMLAQIDVFTAEQPGKDETA